MKPKKGMRFEHTFWLDGNNNPLVFVVTRSLWHGVYYRPVYKRDGREVFGGACYDTKENFPDRVLREVADGAASAIGRCAI